MFCQLDPLLERLGAPRLGATATGVVMMVAWGLGAWRQTVNAIETGRFDPSLPLAFRLARLFVLALEEVFEPGEES